MSKFIPRTKVMHEASMHTRRLQARARVMKEIADQVAKEHGLEPLNKEKEAK